MLMAYSLISVLAWGGTYWLVQREMFRVVDVRLADRMDAASKALERGLPLPPTGEGETATLTQDRSRLGFWTDPQQGAETRYMQRVTPEGTILLGENTERQEELRDILAVGMQLSLLGCLMAAGGAAVLMARRAQKRLNAVTKGLAEIARGDLSRRIQIDGQDDLSLVAGRINATTDRLERAIADMRVQSSNIAHDLRTPLARLRAEIETALIALVEEERSVTEADLSEALKQIDRITGTFEALLRLSQIENGMSRAGFVPVSLEKLVDNIAGTFGPVIEDAGQFLKVEMRAPATVHGDSSLLVQVLANLIQNALRYGPKGQIITLRCYDRQLSVCDEGPGIPVEDRARVLQPLYQMEAARQGEGYGMGLSIVRAIVDLHRTELTFADGDHGRGLTATVRFPKPTKL